MKNGMRVVMKDFLCCIAFGLSCCMYVEASSDEQSITHDSIVKALSRDKTSDHDMSNGTSKSQPEFNIDMTKVNSSSENTVISFDAVNEQVSAIEQQLSAVALQVKALKDAMVVLGRVANDRLERERKQVAQLTKQLHNAHDVLAKKIEEKKSNDQLQSEQEDEVDIDNDDEPRND